MEYIIKKDSINDGVDVLRQVLMASEECYNLEKDIHNHQAYLTYCNQILDYYFENCLGEKYIYSLISFKNELNSLNSIGSTNDSNDVNFNFNGNALNNSQINILKPLLNNLFEDAKTGLSINLTELLLHKRKSHDFYILSSDECKEKMEFWDNNNDKHFSMKNIVWHLNKEEFFKLNKIEIENFKTVVDNENYFNDFQLQNFSNYLWHYKNLEITYKNHFPDKELYVNLIRPAINEYQYNILLSLVTNEPLSRVEFSNINFFLYRILSNTVIEKIKSEERLKRIESESMTTHNFKTYIQSEIINEFNTYKREDEIEDKIKTIELIESNCVNLFTLTGVINLVSKLHDKESLFETGEYDKLLSKCKQIINVKNVIDNYNAKSKRKGSPQIEANFIGNVEDIFIPIGNYYATELLCNNFILTLCENILRHGELNEAESKDLDISITEAGFVFSNVAKSTLLSKNSSLTGNLSFLDNLLNGIKAGSFVIRFPKPGDVPYTYTITYNF